MHTDQPEGLLHNNKPIPSFRCTCDVCGSANVTIEYEFNYYGGYTGYDQTLSVNCRDCRNTARLEI